MHVIERDSEIVRRQIGGGRNGDKNNKRLKARNGEKEINSLKQAKKEENSQTLNKTKHNIKKYTGKDQ